MYFDRTNLQNTSVQLAQDLEKEELLHGLAFLQLCLAQISNSPPRNFEQFLNFVERNGSFHLWGQVITCDQLALADGPGN